MLKTPPILGLAAGLSLLAFAGAAQAAVTVLGGGMARSCSEAALSGESDVRFENLCTMALESEVLDLRDRAGTYVNRGVLKLRRKEFGQALFDFNRAIETKPDLGEAYVNRGAAAVGARRFADGLADINKALELGVEEPEKAYYNRALAYEGLDNLKAAYFDYQKAVELKPEWDAPKNELARFTVERR
ncbi:MULTISPECIES: tetratricopeptide repeat protein [unclassified Phenylobacterium]|jgi:tetratricopeptide (TPR) repeat protein|uniref:tetratricopeptide repeat protein n=1 Tax=unclassified Phenylobacterium TaxID=2640670 RepID=UPI000839F3A5|nr:MULTISPECIES: tetratricopeptide repeat protein [unclassified Phenylobacterium]